LPGVDGERDVGARSRIERSVALWHLPDPRAEDRSDGRRTGLEVLSDRSRPVPPTTVAKRPERTERTDGWSSDPINASRDRAEFGELVRATRERIVETGDDELLRLFDGFVEGAPDADSVRRAAAESLRRVVHRFEGERWEALRAAAGEYDDIRGDDIVSRAFDSVHRTIDRYELGLGKFEPPDGEVFPVGRTVAAWLRSRVGWAAIERGREDPAADIESVRPKGHGSTSNPPVVEPDEIKWWSAVLRGDADISPRPTWHSPDLRARQRDPRHSSTIARVEAAAQQSLLVLATRLAEVHDEAPRPSPVSIESFFRHRRLSASSVLDEALGRADPAPSNRGSDGNSTALYKRKERDSADVAFAVTVALGEIWVALGVTDDALTTSVELDWRARQMSGVTQLLVTGLREQTRVERLEALLLWLVDTARWFDGATCLTGRRIRARAFAASLASLDTALGSAIEISSELPVGRSGVSRQTRTAARCIVLAHACLLEMEGRRSS
jgi:hypothetical protein